MATISLIANSLFQTPVTQGAQNKFQKIQSEFRQLGQDLKAGNLKQAQQDFATPSQDLPISQPNAAASQSSIARALQVLGQDLQSGNLPAAQRDFAAIQQDAQERAPSQFAWSSED